MRQVIDKLHVVRLSDCLGSRILVSDYLNRSLVRDALLRRLQATYEERVRRHLRTYGWRPAMYEGASKPAVASLGVCPLQVLD